MTEFPKYTVDPKGVDIELVMASREMHEALKNVMVFAKNDMPAWLSDSIQNTLSKIKKLS